NPMMIGQNPDTGNRTWDGLIDDVGVWNRPISGEEVALIYNDGAGTALVSSAPYSVGLNFGADAPDGSGAGAMEAGASAGLAGIAQSNWNSLADAAGSSDAVVANDGSSSGITVEWASNNTWSSTGWGEENNGFEGGDRTMMTGYLDTGNATTSTVAISDIPDELSSYDVIVYALGGVAFRGGLYWVEDSEGNVLTARKAGDSDQNPTGYVEDPGVDHSDSGNYLVFSGLSAANIVVVGSTVDDPGIRAPINGVQLVAAAGGDAPALSIANNGDGTVTVTFEGKLQAAASVNGPWADVNESSPLTIEASEAMQYARAVN
ncbi:MAG: LamG domain-containing protein, partial [Actinomycetales bacterium]|nr:LamG domain-containing protein [Actinomycetales bacterium]